MDANLLENITTVEINTVIVQEIIDDVFIPWEAYQALFYLDRSYLEQLAIDYSLSDRYLQLRRQLELSYCLSVIDSSSTLYNRTLVSEIRRDLPILSQTNDQWENLSTRLPEPIPPSRQQNMSAVNHLLNDFAFVNVLRQLSKSKVNLDRRNSSLQNFAGADNIIDTTYAQTSLQLDGKITNRYAQAILQRSDRHLLLKLHEQSTNAGEQQWRGLVKFVLSLVAK